MIPRGVASLTRVTPFPWSPASTTALLTWALGTSVSKSMAVGAARPSIVNGGRPSVEAIRAPIRSSGTMTRFMGRRDNDSSPAIVDANGWAARTPASIRIVLPELPASSTPAGARRPPRPRPSMRKLNPSDVRPTSSMDDAKPAEAFERRAAVAAGRIAMNRGCAIGQSRKQGITVGDRLVAGRPDTSPYSRCGLYCDGLGRGHFPSLAGRPL